ncbi:glycosyl hydrolase, family 31 [Verrucomicrobiia bacterium DG1235]|nr:glycosyl hydrolase, family 31 [Verrucomicrobiae bacterium DG1235]
MSSFPFVPVNGFTPNTSGWSTIGTIDSWTVDSTGRRFTFVFGSRSLYIEIVGQNAYRLRFNPASGATYDTETSTAVVTRDLGLGGVTVNHSQPNPNLLVIDTGSIAVHVALDSFFVSVYRGSQLLHQDAPGQGVLYIPGQQVVAVMKTAAPNASYVGLGEKAGSELLKNQFAYTFFNYDNYTYNGPSLGDPGPLNPTEPLYCSIPFLIENSPMLTPGRPFAGPPYAIGLFLDNPAQSYANISANIVGDNMTGKYYLGALYNELDTYLFVGDDVPGVLQQYTTLTGRAPMPPRYAFGFQQGAYGYFDRYKLTAAGTSYRAARIPCDGLHIDVDFQDNYRTFTHSKMKFPHAKELFDDLHTIGFKMSTNITPIITTNQLNQEGAKAPYAQRDALESANALLYDTRYESGESPELYQGGVNYGNNRGNNPYPSPPLHFNNQGLMPLTAPGNYPDFGLTSVREAWGAQYKHLIQDIGLDMIWQDMTCPAIDPNLPPDAEYYKTFPQDLMMAQEETDANGNVTVTYKPNAQLHNSYVNNLLDGTWNGINKLAPDRRNFIIARGGYAGMQRYAGLWTGDSASSWDFLQINLPEVLNIGLSGVPISGCDIGGFANGSGTTSASIVIGGSIVGGITNYELLTRWMQLGSFLPWYRNHYDGYNKQFQEAFAYGEPVPTNCRKYVELRYRMMQVYYDAMYEWTQSGLPIARALFLNDKHDLNVYSHLNDEFFVGGDVLVAPILFPAETANPPIAPVRGVYLPSGSDWYAFQDNQAPLQGAVTGGTYISNYYADLTLVPIYVRAGAILPFIELEQWVGQLPVNPVTINCYPGPDRWTDEAAYQLYQDDGISQDAAKNGAYRLSRIYQQTQNPSGPVTRNIRIARVHDNYQPSANYTYIALLGSVTSANKVYRDGTQLPDVGDSDSLNAATADAWYWNASIDTVFIKIFDNTSVTTVSANY